MNIKMCIETNEMLETEIKDLLEKCSEKDDIYYNSEPDADFYYYIKNTDEDGKDLLGIDSILYGYFLGEELNNKKVVELEYHKSPSSESNYGFKELFSAFKDDFRDFHPRLILKPSSANLFFIITDYNNELINEIKKSNLSYSYDELMLIKDLKEKIEDPGDKLLNKYGEVYLKPYNSDILYLYGLLTYDKYRHKGYGEKLMKEIEDYKIGSPKSSYNKIMLQVSSKNTSALNLYLKLGYRVIDKITYFE